MKSFMPLKGQLGKAFRNIWIGWLLLFILLWFIHSEATRVHTELFSKNSVQDARLNTLEKQ